MLGNLATTADDNCNGDAVAVARAATTAASPSYILVLLGSYAGLAQAPRRKPRGAEAQTGPRHDVLAASRWRSSWEAGCQQLTAETGVND